MDNPVLRLYPLGDRLTIVVSRASNLYDITSFECSCSRAAAGTRARTAGASEQSGNISADVRHSLAILVEPEVNVPVVGTEPKLIAILMAKDCRHGDAVVANGTVRVDVIELTEVSSQLARFLISLGKIRSVAVAVVANLELNPERAVAHTGTAIAATLTAAAAAPRTIVPRHTLHRSDGAVCEFANPCV